MLLRGVKSLGALSAVVVCLLSGISGAASLGSGENGIKVGEGRLHPYFDLELRFDSAAGYFTSPTASSEALVHFRPGLRMEIPSPTLAVNLAGNVDGVLYTGLITPGSMSRSRFEAEVALDLAANREGQVGFDIGDHFVRSDRTTNVALGIGVLSLYNEVHAAVPIHPGGGALEVTPKGSLTLEFFDAVSAEALAVSGCSDALACSPSSMNYFNYHAGLDARWKFLPKTAVLFEAGFDTRTYFSGQVPPLLLRLQAGLAGLVSAKIATVFKIGWTHNLGGAGTVTGQLEIAYLMSETSTIKAGVLRSVQPVPNYITYDDTRGYFDSRFLFGGKLALHASAAVDWLQFATPARTDFVISADLGPEYQFTPWLIGSLNYNLSLRSSTVSSANFPRHEFITRIEFTY